MFDYLNDCQNKAVNLTSGPVLIVAGAGSGKTGVITCKIAKLIIDNLASSNQITAVTFTNKAASEMKERVRKLIYDNKIYCNVNDIIISTFHSYCSKILRLYIDKIGFKNNFVIYDIQDQKQLISSILKSFNYDLKETKDLVKIFSSVKNGLYVLRQGSQSEKIFNEYVVQLKKANALDFTDLLKYTVLLFKKSSEALNYFQDRAKYFFVDEYQDTNKIQYELIKLISSKYRNICVVGDEDQSIYKWRGADIRNILEFENDYKDAEVIKLEENYRSSKNIISASSTLISNNFERKEKVLFTNNKDGEKVNITELESDDKEAEFISKKIMEERYSGVDYEDMAIFYRINAQSRLIEDKLRLNKIPYKIIGGIKFYDRKEIKDIISYLRLIVNPNDNVSLSRIINVPARSIGKVTIDKLSNFAIHNDLSFFETLSKDIDTVSSGVSLKLKKFQTLIKNFIDSHNEGVKASEILKCVIDQTQYFDFLKESNNFEADERIENISSFLNAVVDFEESNPDLGLLEFLESVALISDTDKELGSDNGVKLMTLHSAKGLEFPVVFIQGLERGLLPYIRYGEEGTDIEEERRLLYVGMTRAKLKLFLTHAASRKIFGGLRARFKSEFINEIDDRYVQKESEIVKYNKNVYFEKKNKYETNYEYLSTDENSVVGRKVKHASYGNGVIKAIEGKGDKAKVTVMFSKYGQKKLIWAYANLQII